jgi:hypothetical protein
MNIKFFILIGINYKGGYFLDDSEDFILEGMYIKLININE